MRLRINLTILLILTDDSYLLDILSQPSFVCSCIYHYLKLWNNFVSLTYLFVFQEKNLITKSSANYIYLLSNFLYFYKEKNCILDIFWS